MDKTGNAKATKKQTERQNLVKHKYRRWKVKRAEKTERNKD